MSIQAITAEGAAFTVTPAAGQTLAQAIWLSGAVPAPALCSGLGRCGRCRVRFLSAAPAPLAEEETLLGAAAVAEGWRLACRRAACATPHCRLELPPAPARHLQYRAAAATGEPLLLAVDLGTTSLHWRALTAAGERNAQGSEFNPQLGAGADVMSRLALAATVEGRARLASLVRARLADIIRELPAPTQEICLAANTAMTDIFLDRDISGLCAAPYRLSHTGHCRVEGLVIAPAPLAAAPAAVAQAGTLPPVYIPPLPAPFIGGDISAGMLALQEDLQPPYPFLLADMGTNGEFALALSPQETLLASVPLGPALEGIGLSMGDAAGPAAATAFRLTPAGLTALTPSGQPAQRICGTGYLSLVSLLLRAGLLDRAGRFLHNPASPLARRLAAGLDREQNLLHCIPPLLLTAGDVEALLTVKAAFSLAVEKLLTAAGLRSAQLSALFLAGALGEHVSPADMETLGFLQPGQSSRLRAVGNTSLRGAELLLLRPALRDRLARWRHGCTTLALTDDPAFTHDYLRHMRF